MIKNKIGQSLRTLRQERGLTQAELARAVGITREHLMTVGDA